MRTKKPPVTPEERTLFREAVGPVRPILHDRVHLRPRRPPPHPRFSQADDRACLQDSLSDGFHPWELETGDELLFARPGLQHRLLAKLRRGQFSVGAELDLHGLVVSEARQAVAGFLQQCRDRGVRCVRIIHGKGLGSRHKAPVLKHKVNHWLRQRDEVLAFCTARPVDGGAGAIYVLLKRR
jgi:DNA-nicking Smr family endonuclease